MGCHDHNSVRHQIGDHPAGCVVGVDSRLDFPLLALADLWYDQRGMGDNKTTNKRHANSSLYNPSIHHFYVGIIIP